MQFTKMIDFQSKHKHWVMFQKINGNLSQQHRITECTKKDALTTFVLSRICGVD